MKKVLALALILLLTGMYPVKSLVIKNEAGQTVFRARVDTNEQLAIKYVHSVERTPWHHYYRVGADKRLHLTHMRFKSFGAGVPHYAPVVRRIDDWIEYAGFDDSFRSLTWHVSDDLSHYLTWRGQDTCLVTLVGGGRTARMHVTYLPLISFLMPSRGGEK